MITGTSYFVNTRAAERYYKPYGFTPADVRMKAARGEICIGIKPPLKPGQARFVNIEEGRYFIEEPVAPPPPIKKYKHRFAVRAYKNYVMRTIDKGPGRCTDQLIATLEIQGRGRAQAYRDARLFAASRQLFEACHAAMRYDHVLTKELSDTIQAAIDAAGRS